MAMRERNDKPGRAVYLNAIGRLWRDDSLGNPMIRGIPQQNERELYALKASQNHLITGSLSARLEKGPTLVPSQRVARFGRIDRSTLSITTGAWRIRLLSPHGSVL
jgi:hypothetical protein